MKTSRINCIKTKLKKTPLIMASLASLYGTATYAAEGLYCKTKGYEAIPTRISDDAALGTHYFSSTSRCQEAVSAARNGIVCTGSAQGEAIPTLISNNERLGRFYYRTLERCTKATRSNKNGLICTADSGSSHSVITRVSDERTVGKLSTQIQDLCIKAIRNSTSEKVCTFDQYSNYAPTSIKTTSILGAYSDFYGCVVRL